MDTNPQSSAGNDMPAQGPTEPIAPLFSASEEIDPLIQEVVGEDFFEKPALSSKSDDDSKETKKEGSEEKKPNDAQSPQKNAETHPEKTSSQEEEGKEKPEAGSKESSEAVYSGNQEQPKARGLERRIAMLYDEIRVLEGDEPSGKTDEIAAEVAKYPFQDRQKALRRLLAKRAELRNPETSGIPTLSKEDLDVIAEARAHEILSEKESERELREWNEDLVKTYEAHPELDESRQEYNPAIAEAVTAMVNGGMRLSEAYSRVMSIAEKTIEETKKKAESERARALSGTVSMTGNSEVRDGMSWEELARIREEDPEEYLRKISKGDVPKD